MQGDEFTEEGRIHHRGVEHAKRNGIRVGRKELAGDGESPPRVRGSNRNGLRVVRSNI
jgi:hypothetical protein